MQPANAIERNYLVALDDYVRNKLAIRKEVMQHGYAPNRVSLENRMSAARNRMDRIEMGVPDPEDSWSRAALRLTTHDSIVVDYDSSRKNAIDDMIKSFNEQGIKNFLIAPSSELMGMTEKTLRDSLKSKPVPKLTMDSGPYYMLWDGHPGEAPTIKPKS